MITAGAGPASPFAPSLLTPFFPGALLTPFFPGALLTPLFPPAFLPPALIPPHDGTATAFVITHEAGSTAFSHKRQR